MFGTPSITCPDLPGDVTVLGMRIVTPDLMKREVVSKVI